MTLRAHIVNVARELLPLPTAPFREHRVREYIRVFCRTRGIAVREDDMGNLIVTHGAKYRNAVLAFAAHMDHPGFIIEKDSQRLPRGGTTRRTTALFYGGVEEKFFKTARVRVFSDAGDAVGRVTRTEFRRKKRTQRVWLTLDGDVKRGDVAMWDLPAMRIRGDRLHARTCDDTVGCVAVLGLLDELVRRRIRKKVLGVFTVAEEGGLNGAKYLAMKRGIPKSAHLVAIETSRERPTARIGRGAVIRVGDRERIFHPGMTRFMERAARCISSKDKDFRCQRALMDGGTCETSIYQAFGYTAGAACVPLGNYHNRNARTTRIAPEVISVSDLENLVKLFVAMTKRSDDLPKFIREKPPLYKEERRALGERLLFRTDG